jgi:hypothetical protein
MTVSTLPDLYERLGAHGDHAGADAVVARAVAAAGDRPSPIPLTFSSPPRRGRRTTLVLTAAVLTVALVALPVVLNRSSSSRPSREPIGPAYPPAASASAAQLATMHWSRIAEAPIPLLTGDKQLVAWVGNEVVVYGQDLLHDDSHGIGAAYDPATNRWRMLPRAPLRGVFFFKISWVWTGKELILFPDTGADVGARRGEAYSPRTNSWRVLSPGPMCTVPEAGVVWTGRAVVVAGGFDISGSPCSDARAAESASYDPRTDHWTTGPRLPVRKGDRLEQTQLVWADGRVVAILASQHRSPEPSASAAATGTTTVSTPGSGQGTTPLKSTDPIVRAYSWTPGSSSWQGLGDITAGLSGEPVAQSNWAPYAAGSQIAYPPALRYCGEGEQAPCSVPGVQSGGAYDVATGHHLTLTAPTLPFPSSVDSNAFSGSAVIASMHGGSSKTQTFAWDVATGRRVELARPPATPILAAWTGTELVVIAIPDDNGHLIGLRLGR